ncbi:OmpP1/FadL family transporter [Pseudomonadota bacterium]
MLLNRKALLLVAMTATGSAHADDFHYVNLLIGDRAAGMGGAYTAVSDDASGLFYNPAGIVYAPGSSLSGSMNTFHEATTTYEKALSGEHNWTRHSESLLPNFFGLVQPLGNGTIGFSYAVPNSIEEDQDQEFTNIALVGGLTARDFIINFNNTDKTYNFGPSYAYKINEELSVGGTLYLHVRQQQRISNVVMVISGDRVWTNDYFELEEFGVKPVLGLMWSPQKQLAIGASISKVSLLQSTFTNYQTCVGANGITYTASSLCQSGDLLTREKIVSHDEAEYPLNIRLGAAWFASDALLISADISHNTAHSSGENTRVSVTNVALGTEYYLNPSWALRGGVFTDYANTPELQAGITSYNQLENVDLYGASASVSHFTRNSSISLGFTYSVGAGKAQIVGGDATLQNVDIESFGISLAASYAY